jgi:hypothetical protein
MQAIFHAQAAATADDAVELDEYGLPLRYVTILQFSALYVVVLGSHEMLIARYGKHGTSWH